MQYFYKACVISLTNVVTRLPEILDNVVRHLEAVNQQLALFPMPTFDDPRKEVIGLLRDFTRTFAKHIEGLPPSCTADPDDPAMSSLMHSFNLIYRAFRTELHRTAPQFRPWSTDDDFSRTLESQLLATLAENDPKEPCIGRKFYADQILDLAERSRTRELPGNYPFAVKVTLIDEATKTWRKLAGECFETVRDAMVDHVGRLVKEHFGKYAHGGLLDKVA